jgi:penicillin-binding protein 2
MSKGFHPDQEFSRRMFMAGVGGGVVWAGLVARLFQLQILEGKKYDELANENHIKLELAPPQRGRILDRFGKPLASHRRAGRVTVMPEQLKDPAATIASIRQLIELSDGQVERVMEDIRRARLRRAAFLPVIVANELSYEDFARMNVHAVELPGVQVEMALTRSYPRGRDFAHVLGLCGPGQPGRSGTADRRQDIRRSQTTIERMFRHPDMRTGRQGMERFAEEWLRGKPGFKKLVTNAAGRVIDQIPDERLAPEAGKDLLHHDRHGAAACRD